MKKGWKVERLGDVVEFQRGLTYSKKDEVEFSSNIVLRANNVDLNTNALDFTELKYIKETVVVPKEKKVSKGSLIICTASGSKSHLGKVALINKNYDYAFGGFMGQITPKKNIDSKFLFYRMISEDYKTFIGKLSDGVNINNLRFDDLANFEIPLPPLPEQKRIVSLLDECFAALAQVHANAGRNLVNAREVFESYLEEVFTNSGHHWKDMILDSVCSEITVGHVGPMASKYKSTGIPFLRSQNIKPNQINLNNVVYIDNHFNSQLKKSQLSPGDVVIVRTGYPGTSAVIPDNLQMSNCSDLVIVKPSESVNPHYLCLFFNSTFGKRLVLGNIVGAAQKHFNVTAAKNVSIPVPPLGEQSAIVARLDGLARETSRLEEVYRQKVEDVEELRKTILKSIFQT